MAASVALAFVPPVAGIPLAAYAAVALLLLGGMAALPWLLGQLLRLVPQSLLRRPLALLPVERARRMRRSTTVAVGGVVASLSLAVALTVMVASFRDSMIAWLDAVLPAPLYLRTAGSAGRADAAPCPPIWPRALPPCLAYSAPSPCAAPACGSARIAPPSACCCAAAWPPGPAVAVDTRPRASARWQHARLCQ